MEKIRKVAITGTFDPITKGHLDIIERAKELYDELYIVILINPDKIPALTIDERLGLIKKATANLKGVFISSFKGMAVDFCHMNDINYIVRGIRNDIDYRYEKEMAAYNKKEGNIETVFLLARPDLIDVSSGILRKGEKSREIIEKLLPADIVEDYIDIIKGK
jgi:pantetheine-phosphate adenylyltransferase